MGQWHNAEGMMDDVICLQPLCLQPKSSVVWDMSRDLPSLSPYSNGGKDDLANALSSKGKRLKKVAHPFSFQEVEIGRVFKLSV